MMTENLKGKTAVITGSGGGIGRATAMAMAAEGANIVVNDIGRDPDGAMTADLVVDEIRRSKGAAVANYNSVGTMSGGAGIINSALESFGTVDILVNCAGNFKAMPTIEMTEKDWDSIMDIHLKGHLSCIKAALPHLIQKKNGRIINISSRAALGDAAISLPYATAKTAILGLTKSLSIEMKEHGITVNALLPSAATSLFPGKEREFRAGGFPYPESLEPEWIAPIIAYLATDRARNVSGKFIYASGGDICVYDNPLKPLAFIRKVGKWTIDEISEVFPDFADLV
ncbi:MAG: SDR family NAD(P)-dependent oxidoreductase [Deltaproteobacteria bacterium]|nr:SDR family NAD(P)-dependent oxidoreductase [Deltaproteobacteria bacterium]